MNINDILLAQNIKRWTIVSTIKEQSLAEHLFNVTMIARDICVEANIDDYNVIKYALDHDLDEIETGDIPSPAKQRLNMTGMYRGKSWNNCNTAERLIVKAADLIDAYLFIKYNKHDRHGQQVLNWTKDKLDTFIAAVNEELPTVAEAIENTIAMIDFGIYDVEDRS